MNKVLISEIFTSIQGEGLHTGHKSLFIRFFGCNLRCMFGARNYNDVDNVIKNIDQYHNLKELPLIKTCCDSYPSVWPGFQKFSKEYTLDELFNIIREYATSNRENHIVFTGGEPLLYQSFLYDLIKKINDELFLSRFVITFETNTTRPLTEKFENLLISIPDIKFVFSCSPKLSCSGLNEKQRLHYNVMQDYINLMASKNITTYLKFVVDGNNSKDIDEIIAIEKELKKLNCLTVFRDGEYIRPAIYLMPLGGVSDKDYQYNAQKVAEICMKYNFVFCDRVHLRVFKNQWGC